MYIHMCVSSSIHRFHQRQLSRHLWGCAQVWLPALPPSLVLWMVGKSCTNLGVSSSSWGYPFIAGWFLSWKIPSFEIRMITRGTPVLGNPQDSVQLPNKWLKMVDITIVFMGVSSCFINQRQHIWGSPSCIHVLSLDVYLCVFIHNNYPIYIMKTNIYGGAHPVEQGNRPNRPSTNSCRISPPSNIFEVQLGGLPKIWATIPAIPKGKKNSRHLVYDYDKP